MGPIKTEVLQFEDAAGNKYDDLGWHAHVRDQLLGRRTWPGDAPNLGDRGI